MPASRSLKQAAGMGDPIPIADAQGRNYAGLGMMKTGPLDQPLKLPDRQANPEFMNQNLLDSRNRYTAGLDLLVNQYGSLLDIPEDIMQKFSHDMGWDPPQEYIYNNIVGRDLTAEQKDYIKKTDPGRYELWLRTRRAESNQR